MRGKDFVGSKLRTAVTGIIAFVVDWCPYCSQLLPELEAAAAQDLQEAQIFVCNCQDSANRGITELLGVQAYPTLKVVINGRISEDEYSGERKADAIAAFVKTLPKTQ